MTSYTFVSEQAKERTITTAEEAKQVIKATSIVRCYTYKEVQADPIFQEIAQTFGLDLSSIVVAVNENPDDFPFCYSF